jgi:hypothetical protein
MDGHERCSDCGQRKVACPYCQGLGRIGAGGFGAPRCRECDGAGVRCPDVLSRGSNYGGRRELIRQSELPRQARLASRSSRPRPSPPSRPPARQPSWGTVLATTVRLWTGRRLRPWWRTRWQDVLAALLVAVILISFAITLRLSGGSGGGQAVGQPGGGPALGAVAAAQRQAAAWVASQASGDAIVACDPAMCAVLQARGVPASRLLVLTSARADPLGSDLVVATAAVRSQFGGRLAGVYAPVTLASFGSGATRIAVQAVAPDGSAAYRTQLAGDIRGRQVAGAQLLHNHHVHVAGAARSALTGGQVDSRLLATLATLGTLHPLDIISFGGSGPGASAGVPLRSAEIAAAAPPGRRHPASLASLLAFFRAQRPPYLPASLEPVRITPRRTGLRIEYQVPCPLGLLGPAADTKEMP